MNRRLLSLIKTCIYVLVIGVPLFYFKQGVYPYILSKTLFAQIVIEIALFAWLALMIMDARYRPKMSPLLWSLAAFLGIFALTAAFGEDPARSFWSSQERATGIILFFHLGLFALMMQSVYRHLKFENILRASIGTSVFVSFLAFLQLQIPNLLLVEAVGDRPGATFGNPTFFAGYLLFNIFFACYFAFRAWKKDSQVVFFFGAAAVVNVIALFITQTRGDILGLAAGILALIAVFAIRPPEFGGALLRSRRFYGAIIGVLILFGAGFWFTKSAAVWEHVPGLERFRDISLQSEGLQPRLIAMRAAWEGFLERPVRGWGWENFAVVYNKHYDPKALELSYQETRFDKPHNLYLEYMIAGGAPLTIAFLVMIGLLCCGAYKIEDKLLGAFLIASIAAYMVRSVFIFDTLGPLIMLYLVLGLVLGMERMAREKVARADGSAGTFAEPVAAESDTVIAGGALLAALIVAYFVNVTSLVATYHQYYGFKYFTANKPTEAIASFRKAVDAWTPYKWNLERDYAAAVSEAYFYNPTLVPKEEAARAIAAMEDVARTHPMDAYNHYALVDMYNEVSDIDPAKYLSAAEDQAKIALQLSPDRQEVYFSLAKTKSLKGDYASALDLLKYALNLNPKIPDAHFYYGLIAYAAKEPEVGYTELKTAIDMGRPWKNNNEPRVVADFFADSGHIDEAVGLYEASLKIKEDPEARLKLGLVYYFLDRRQDAYDSLKKALTEFDVTKSPAYQDILPILQDLGLSA
jgi:O-antigen ligase